MYQPKFFTFAELQRKSSPNMLVNDDFLEKMDTIRQIIGEPIIVNSYYRSREHEKSLGRAGTSSHCLGLAMDIACPDSLYRWKVVTAALSVGISRIGLGARFIHLDIDDSKPSPRIWYYNY